LRAFVVVKHSQQEFVLLFRDFNGQKYAAVFVAGVVSPRLLTVLLLALFGDLLLAPTAGIGDISRGGLALRAPFTLIF